MLEHLQPKWISMSDSIFYVDKSTWPQFDFEKHDITKTRKDFRKFWRKIKEKVKKKDFNFNGYKFPDFTGEGISEILEEANFSKAQFQGITVFEGVKFGKKVVFDETIFSGSLRINECFLDNVSFKNVVFGLANFEKSKFEGYTSFKLCKFLGHSEFNENEFREGISELLDVNFRNTQFNGNTVFEGVEFHSKAVFDETTFSGSLLFNSCLFDCVSFKKVHFELTNFKKSKFQGYTTFEICEFLGPTEFNENEFQVSVSFEAIFSKDQFSIVKSKFNSNVIFLNSEFRKRFELTQNEIKGLIDFSYLRSYGILSFEHNRFYERAIFKNSVIHDDASFINSEFFSLVDFNETIFKKRAQFYQTKFRDEVILTNNAISFLKDIEREELNFENSVLEEARFFNSSSLDGYSFKGAFLLSMSLANKIINDCDFTGAVIGAVQTRGWKPDSLTLEKTKYVYTNWMTETIVTESGKQTKYKPDLDSRVPAEGEFGERDNKGFTLLEYLKDPFRWSLGLKLPVQIRNGFISYIQFYSEFMRLTQNISVEVRTRLEGQKVRVEFLTEKESEKEQVQKEFEVYMKNVAIKDMDHIEVHFAEDVSQMDKDLFQIKYEYEINHLQTELKYTKRLLDKYEKDDSEIKAILKESVNASKNPMNIFIKSETNPEVNVDNRQSIDVSTSVPLLYELLGELRKNDLDDSQKSKNIKLLVEKLDYYKSLADEDQLKSSDKSKFKGFMNKAAKTFAKGGNYVLQNQDKIIQLIEKINETL